MGIHLYRAQRAVFVCLLFFASVSTWAAEPDSAVLKNFLSFEIPSGWEVLDVEVSNSTNFGTEANPFYKQKFTAKLAPAKPLYSHQKWLGGTEVIELHASQEQPLTVRGVASSELKNERWNSQFEYEGKPFEAGKPIESFSATAILAGSADEQQITQKMQQQKIVQDREKADLEAKKRALKAQAEQKEQQRMQKLNNLIAKYSAIPLPSHQRLDRDDRFQMAPGKSYYFIIDGSSEAPGGFCWGTGKYRAMSNIVRSAIHSGAISIGETAIIRVSVVPHNKKFINTTQHGTVCGDHTLPDPVALTFKRVHDNDYNEI